MKKKDLKKALVATRIEIESLRAALTQQQIADRRTLGEWLDIWEPERLTSPHLKSQTLLNRRTNFRHCRRLWGDRSIRSIKPHEISASLRDEFLPKNSSTAQRVLSELREAYSHAIAAGWVDVNPAKSVKAPSHQVKRKRLTFAVWKRMRKFAQEELPPWVDAMLVLALITGQRRADLMKMGFDDIVTDASGNEFLRVEQTKKQGKRAGSRIEIPLALHMKSLDMTVGDAIDYCRKIGKPGATFLRKANGGAIERSSLSARFGECIRNVLGFSAYDLHEWPSLHEVRSLTARMYRAQGLDSDAAQTLLGHKMKEFMQVYEDERDLAVSLWTRVQLNPKPT